MAVSEEETTYVEVDTVDLFYGGEEEPLRPEPGRLRTGPHWGLDHYEPHTNRKKLGIWPGRGTPDWARLRTKWGFTGIVVDPSTYQNAINAGFNWKDFMVRISPTNYQGVIDSYLSGAYYSDEPFHRNCRPDQWINPEWQGNLYMLSVIRGYANSRNSKYVISHYFDCDHVLEYFDDVDVFMYDGYRKHNMRNSECFNAPSDDQRDTWTRWRTQFPDQFTRVWVSAGPGDGNDDDENEYNDLMGHAAPRFGYVWLFVGPDGTEGHHISRFCFFSWMHNWLRRFEYQYYIWWRCVEPNPNYCNPENPEQWVIWYIEPTYQCREALPSGGYVNSSNCLYN